MDDEVAVKAAPITLAEHECRSHKRYKKLKQLHEKGIDTMSAREDLNIIGGQDGGFGGGGMLGMVALLALLGRRGGGFLGGDEGGGVGLQNSIDTNAILTSLGDIKASVPLAEAQVQLALAGQAASLTGQANQNTQYLSNGQTQIQLAQQASTAALSREICSVDTNVDRQATAIQMAIKDDGEKTRALITSNQISELQRLASERQDEIIELRNGQQRDRDRHGIEINMINNQNQNQMQFQQQSQVLNTLTHALVDVSQVARATNQSLIIGNTGTTRGGNQSANPTNVNA